jgi:RNA polymerase sigma factor (sigma-70 family)
MTRDFATGDPNAVRAVFRSYGKLVYAVAYKVLGDAPLAEEATQQTFVQAWKSATTYDPSRALGAWLTIIARRAAIDVYRRERRHRDMSEIDLTDPALAITPPSAEQISDVWEVRQALDSLPAQERELLRLQHYADLTHTEIASELAIPLGTVKSRSFRAHKRLAGLLGHLQSDRSPYPAGPAHQVKNPHIDDEVNLDG